MTIAIGTLAVGMAIVTTVFAIFNAALLAPAPYANASRLHAISEQREGFGAFSTASHATIDGIRHGARSFARVAAYRTGGGVLSAGQLATQVVATEVDTSVFALLGIPPRAGRLPSREEITDRSLVIVLSDRIAHLIAPDGDAVGRSVHFRGGIYTVVGVMPPQFNFPDRSDVWLALEETRTNRSYGAEGSFSVVGELLPGVAPDAGQRDLDRLDTQLRESDKQYYWRVSLQLRDEVINRRTTAWAPILVLFLGAAGCVMLIGCVNVGNLLLMRAAERRQEHAVRTVLGATFQRLVRQVAVESAMISAIAAIAGGLLTLGFLRSADRIFPIGNMPTWFRLSLDGRVLLILVVAVVAAVFLTSGSAIRQLRGIDLNELLKGGGQNSTSASVTRVGERGVVMQVLLCSALTIVASIFTMGYRNVLKVPAGYDRDRLLQAQIFPDTIRYSDTLQRQAVDRRFSLRLTESSAIESEGRDAFFMGFLNSPQMGPIDYDLYRSDDLARSVTHNLRLPLQMHVISDGYFRAVGVPLVAGRTFVARDTIGSELIAVISERLARMLFPTGAAVGNRMRVGKRGPLVNVVGVVGDVRVPTNAADGLVVSGRPEAYFSERQAIGATPTHWVRARQSIGAAKAVIMAQIQVVAPGLQAFYVGQPQEDDNVLVLRTIAEVLVFTGGVALAMAILGIYAITGYAVVQRTRMIGIQLALGASPGRVYFDTLRRGLWLVGCGLLLGLSLGAVLELLVRPAFWGATPFSVAVYTTTIVLFMLVGLLACHQAAARGSRLHPAVALRS